jgi:hypothetical protein
MRNRDRTTFERALEAARRRTTASGEGPSDEIGFADPMANMAAPINPEAPSAPSGGLWEFAASWAPRAEDPASRTASPPSADVESILRELSLPAVASMDELARARRRFMWANHPDRHPDVPTWLANRRVAIANMLIDRVIASGAKAKRSR